MKEMHWQKLKNGKIIQLEFIIKRFSFCCFNDDHDYNEDYGHKVEDQINRSSFVQLDHNPTQESDFKVEK